MQTMTARQMYAEAWMYYLSGNFTIKQISDVLDIPYNILCNYAGRNKWARLRSQIHKDAGKGLKDSLAERIERERIRHQNFMLDQLDETSEAIAGRIIGEVDPEDPKGERKVKVVDKLGLIEQQHRIAGSVLKLDEVEKSDPTRIGFEFLMSLQAKPLPANSDANTGILSSNNALPDVSHEPEMEVEAQVFDIVDGKAVARIETDNPPSAPELPAHFTEPPEIDPNEVKLKFY